MIEKLKKLNTINVFCILVIISISAYFLGLIFTNGNLFNLLEENLKSKIMFDHAEKIIASAKGSSLYNDSWESFPPFAYLLYNILYRVNPNKVSVEIMNLFNKNNFSSLIQDKIFDYAFDINFIIQTIIVYIFIIFILFFVIKKYMKDKNICNVFLFFFSIIFSYLICMRCIPSGNSVFVTAVILSLSLYYILYDNSGMKKDIGIFLLSVAFGLKLYPCLFSLIFIKDKDIKSFVKFCIYSIFIFFIPFIFYGGVEGFLKYVNIIFDTNGGYQYNVCCIAYPFLLFTKNVLNMPNSDIRIVLSIVRYLFFLIMLIMFFISKKNYQKAFFITSICIHYFPKAFDYNLIYYLPIILIFLKDNERIDKLNVLEIIIFVLLSLLFSYYFVLIGSSFYVYISFILILLFVIVVLCEKQVK